MCSWIGFIIILYVHVRVCAFAYMRFGVMCFARVFVLACMCVQVGLSPIYIDGGKTQFLR